MMRSFTMLFLLLCLTACMVKCSGAWGAELRTLEWDANAASEQVMGYRIYKMPDRLLLATAPGTVATVPLEVGEVVAVTAYNVTAESGLSDPLTITAPIPTIDRSGWTATASSAESVGENTPASNAIDGQAATMWHTDWDALAPHCLAIALPRAATVSRLDYLPRQDASANGRILGYEIQSSTDGIDWQAWATGAWANDATEKSAALPLREIRFFRLWGNEPWASAAEINLRGSYAPATVRVTLQRGNLTTWQDIRTDEFPKLDMDFFRLKIEPR